MKGGYNDGKDKENYMETTLLAPIHKPYADHRIRNERMHASATWLFDLTYTVLYTRVYNIWSINP